MNQSRWAQVITLGISIIFILVATYFALQRWDPKYQNFRVSDLAIGMSAGMLIFLATAFLAWVLAVDKERHPKNRNLFRAFENFFGNKPPRGALWEVVDGKLNQTRSAEGEVAGPARIVIPRDHAIVFENKSGKFTHAEFGPVEVDAQSADELSRSIVVITRPRFKRLSVHNVVTQDGVVIERLDFSIFYHLKTDPHQFSTENIQYPISQDTLTQAAYAVTFGEDEQLRPITTWEAAVQGAARDYLRSEISSVVLLSLYAGDSDQAPMRQISERVKSRLNELVNRWGVQVQSFEILHLAIPSQLQKKMEEKWIAQRSEEIKEAEGKAEGKKIEQIERAKAKAWKDMVKRMSQSFGKAPENELAATHYIQIMQYLDSLVRMSQSPSVRMIPPPPKELESLMSEYESRLREAQVRQESEEQQTAGPKVERTPNATIVGTQPQVEDVSTKEQKPPQSNVG